jgi:hypothetical protein
MMQDGFTLLAVDRLEKNRNLWLILTNKYLDRDNLTPVQIDIAGNFKSLLNEPQVICDLKLLAGFFRGYFLSHMKFFQGIDRNIGTSGYVQLHVVSRVFLMLDDIHRLAAYRTNPCKDMEPFIEAINALSTQQEQEEKHWEAEQFFEIASDELKKMFCRWIDHRLFFLAAFGEYHTGKLVARYMLADESTLRAPLALLRPSESIHFDSYFHGGKSRPVRRFNLRDFIEFLVVDCGNIGEIKSSPHTIANQHALERIADGVDIWDRSSEISIHIATEILTDYGGLPAVTQMIERCNKNHNICSESGKEERAINARMTARSLLTECTSVTTIDGKRPPSSGPEYVRRIYDNLDTLTAASEEIRRNMPVEQQDAWEAHIEKSLFDKSETFSEKTYQEKKKSIKINEPVHRHRAYAAEIRTGYQKSPFAQKKRRYGKLGTMHVPVMREELDARGLSYLKEWGIKLLSRELKLSLRNDWIKANPNTDEKVYDDDDEKTKWFHPVIGAHRFVYNEVSGRR